MRGSCISYALGAAAPSEPYWDRISRSLLASKPMACSDFSSSLQWPHLLVLFHLTRARFAGRAGTF